MALGTYLRRRARWLKYLLIVPAVYLCVVFLSNKADSTQSQLSGGNKLPVIEGVGDGQPFVPKKPKRKVEQPEDKVFVLPVPGTDGKANPNGPGELGKAVSIKKEELGPKEKKLFDDGWQNNVSRECQLFFGRATNLIWLKLKCLSRQTENIRARDLES